MSARILVADDDPQVLATLDRILSGAGYSVTTASDGASALRLAQTGTAPDLVLSDLDMPVLTGLQLVAELKADPTLTSTPVLILTAQADLDLHDQATKAGAAGVLTKPTSAQEILHFVAEALAGS